MPNGKVLVGEGFASAVLSSAELYDPAAHPLSLTPEQFVAVLDTNAGGVLSPAERSLLAGELATGAKTRAQVLRAVAEDTDLVRA